MERNIDVEDVITTYQRGDYDEIVSDSDYVGQTVIYDARTELELPLLANGEVVTVIDRPARSVRNLVKEGKWLPKRRP